MALFSSTAEAFLASREWDKATLTRVAFWVEQLGFKDLLSITEDDIDRAMMALAQRGRLKGGKLTTVATGKPLSGPTMNRYLTQAGSIFKYARKKRLVPRSHVPPTRGFEREPEPVDPDRYLRPEEVPRAVAIARVLDRRWGKMAALIVTAYHTGMRVGSMFKILGQDLDLNDGRITVGKTKNGAPITVALSTDAIKELKRLPKVGAMERVFGNRAGKPFAYKNLWKRIAREARLEGRVFHELRHGNGHQLARNGVSQSMIMKCMGHKTLAASARYVHASIDDKKEIVARVFG